jgi:hypothetical protein
MTIESTGQSRPADPNARLKRYLTDALAGVVGVLALIVGIASGTGLAAGVGIGALSWCALAIANDLVRARREGDETMAAATPTSWRWALTFGVLVAAGGLVGFLLKP